MLSRTDLRELGWERRAVDAIFRELDVVFLPGYSRAHGAMVLDHAGVTPNPAQHKSIKLPREEPEEINPPTAEDVELVDRCFPSSTGSRCFGSTGRAHASRVST